MSDEWNGLLGAVGALVGVVIGVWLSELWIAARYRRMLRALGWPHRIANLAAPTASEIRSNLVLPGDRP